MQIAYFDESGIDGAHDVTLIAGFAARINDWPATNAAWRAQLQANDVPCFHYIDCVNQTRAYGGWDWHRECKPHLNRMALILAQSPIGGVSAIVRGNWRESVKDRPSVNKRFPSAYHLCFELLMHKIRREMNFHGQEDIVMIFAKQRQYQRRALEVWDWHRERGAWPEIKDVRYEEPTKVVGLQMADMLAWETRRIIHKGDGILPTLPLLSRLIPKQAATGTALYDVANRRSLDDILSSLPMPITT